MRYDFHHTCEAEIDHVMQLLLELEWFARNNYSISLPDGITASSSRDAIVSAVEREFATYAQVFQAYKNTCQKALNTHHSSIDAFFALFDYPRPSTITVQCSAYGPGGSYTPPDTITVLLKNSDEDPLHLIIHESVHLILEEPFIQKYGLTHWGKEYMVDHLCKQSGIADFAHAYTIQKHVTPPSADVIRDLFYKKKINVLKRKNA